MARQVLLHDDFLQDARRHEAWLVRNGQEEWLANLLSGIEEIAALLRDFPAIGTVILRTALPAVKGVRCDHASSVLRRVVTWPTSVLTVR